jgi:hypothetical protein
MSLVFRYPDLSRDSLRIASVLMFQRENESNGDDVVLNFPLLVPYVSTIGLRCGIERELPPAESKFGVNM